MRHLSLVVLTLLTSSLNSFSQTWETAKNSGEAELVLVWYESNPFIYEDEDGSLSGLEYDLLLSFKDYVKKEYDVNLSLKWSKSGSFSEIIKIISKSPRNHLGVSAFSITEKRKKEVRFSKAYLPDITVLVSSKGAPIVKTSDEINQMIKNMEAVTIEGTTYEKMLHDMEEQLNVDLNIKYISSDKNILDYIASSPNRYGFIDLPIYLMRIRDGEEFTRQNFLTVRGNGYGFAMPKESDWHIPVNEFLNSSEYKSRKDENISTYISPELHDFIENVYLGDQLGTSILTKEKEIQLALIKNANLKIEEEQSFIRVLIYSFTIALLLLVVIGFLFYKNNRNTRELISQKYQIEAQQRDIREKNDQLINRNVQLMSINEEKNNLVKILAHDLRSPLSQIIGLSDLIIKGHTDVPGEDKEMVSQINHSAQQINELINKILNVDTLESNHIPVLKEYVSPNAIMHDVVKRLRVSADKKNIKLELVECDEKHFLYTDHLLIFQILDNLVSNSIKFSKFNSEVILRAKCNENKVTFQVQDLGPGFSEDDKINMFNKFQKLSAKPTADEPSIGLGLSIVRRYTNELGGEIDVDSEQGKGTTFSVILPKKA